MKIAVILTARPSWAKLSTLCAAFTRRPGVELQIIACASALLERYGKVVEVVRQEGFDIAAEVWSTYEGANLLTSAKETGALLTEVGAVLSRLRPDCVVVCADRHEVLGAAQAARYLHVPCVHLQGGERSGSVDDRVRDAITALADYHFVATKRALMRVYALTGDAERIWHVGCPSIDIAKQALSEPPVEFDELQGTGPRLDLAHRFLVVMQHPVTNEADHAEAQMRITLQAVGSANLPKIVFWPGEDAGADGISRAIRAWRHQHPEQSIYTVKNFAPNRFLRLLSQASALVGNSSCGIRECSYLGVPVVNIGTRQQGRERAHNVIDVPHVVSDIKAAIEYQAAKGKCVPSELYGSGNAGERIAGVLCQQIAMCSSNGKALMSASTSIATNATPTATSTATLRIT